jgi:hypothetical protein
MFSDRIATKRPLSAKAEDVATYEKDLNAALRSAELDATCMVIALDASIPHDSTFQATIATLVYSGGNEVRWITSVAGRRTSPEAEHFSLQVGLSAALHAGELSSQIPCQPSNLCWIAQFVQGKSSPWMLAKR